MCIFSTRVSFLQPNQNRNQRCVRCCSVPDPDPSQLVDADGADLLPAMGQQLSRGRCRCRCRCRRNYPALDVQAAPLRVRWMRLGQVRTFQFEITPELRSSGRELLVKMRVRHGFTAGMTASAVEVLPSDQRKIWSTNTYCCCSDHSCDAAFPDCINGEGGICTACIKHDADFTRFHHECKGGMLPERREQSYMDMDTELSHLQYVNDEYLNGRGALLGVYPTEQVAQQQQEQQLQQQRQQQQNQATSKSHLLSPVSTSSISTATATATATAKAPNVNGSRSSATVAPPSAPPLPRRGGPDDVLALFSRSNDHSGHTLSLRIDPRDPQARAGLYYVTVRSQLPCVRPFRLAETELQRRLRLLQDQLEQREGLEFDIWIEYRKRRSVPRAGNTGNISHAAGMSAKRAAAAAEAGATGGMDVGPIDDDNPFGVLANRRDVGDDDDLHAAMTTTTARPRPRAARVSFANGRKEDLVGDDERRRVRRPINTTTDASFTI